MPQLSARQQVRQETRNSQGEYAAYDAAPSNASLDMGIAPDGGVGAIAERHGVEVHDPDANPIRVHGRTQDIRAMALDMEREHGVSTEVRGIHPGGPGVEDEDYPLDEHVDPDQEVEADIYHREGEERHPVDDAIAEAGVEGYTLDAHSLSARAWEDSGSNLPPMTSAEAQQRLTYNRNAGVLLRNSDGSYSADQSRPLVEGERISGSEALNEIKRSIDPQAGQLTTGHRINVGTWVRHGDETAEPTTREMVIDDTPGSELKLVNDDPRGGDFDIYTVPLSVDATETGAEPRITRDEDGTITVEVDEEIADNGDVIPGQRFTLSPANLTDDYTSPRPLTNDRGEESPFDVGPTKYDEDPDYGDRVTLTKTVHRPDGEKVGRIYQGDQRQWVIDYGGGDMEDPAFDTAEEAAEHLHYASGGRGEWSKPSAENVPLFDLDG